MRLAARPLSGRQDRPRRRLCVARLAVECAERACVGDRVRPAAGDKTNADTAKVDPRCLPRAGAGCAVRAVHLFGGAADPEIAARGFHRSLRADLDEPSASPCLGVSQGLNRARIPQKWIPVLRIEYAPVNESEHFLAAKRLPLRREKMLNRRNAAGSSLIAIWIMAALKILVIPGSLRTGSLNVRLAAATPHPFPQTRARVNPHFLPRFSLP